MDAFRIAHRYNGWDPSEPAAERRHLADRRIAYATERVADLRERLAAAEAALVVARERAAHILAGGDPGCPCGDPDCDGVA